jgi:hypothetical protein
MANLYYNNAAVDYAWDTLGNWWNDAAFTSPAAALPTTGDTVYLSGAMLSGPSTSVTLAHIYVDNGSVNFTGAVGNATFNDSSSNGSTVSGNATFNDSSQNYGTVTGDATFTASSFVDINFGSAGSYNFTSSTPVTFTYSNLDWTYDPSSWIFTTASPTWTFNSYHNFGTVTGDATFNGYSFNQGTVTGDATFNESGDNYGTVSGNATFNGYGDYPSYNGGTVSGNATFNDSSYNSPSGTVAGNATFNNSSYNGGTVSGNATFNDFSYNASGGIVTGNATFNEYSYNGQTVTGNATFNHYSFNNNTFAVVFGDTVTFNDYSYNAGDGGLFTSGVVDKNSIFNDFSYNSGQVCFTSGVAIFNDSSYNSGTVVNGNAAFFDSSYNTGTVTGDLYINGTYYIGGEATATLFFTNTSGDGLWATLLNWENHLGENPKEVPWAGFLTGLVNLQIASGAPAPLPNGLLVGGKRKIVSTCDERIAQAIIQNGLNIVSPLIYI